MDKSPSLKIDSHQHFWKFDPVRDSWITDDMSVIQKDFLPEDLQPVLLQNNIDGCVAVQACQSEEETNFLISLAEKNDFIKGVVGWVDLQKENVTERLSSFSKFKKLKGFRHVLQGETDRQLMLRPNFERGITALKEFDFTYDILIFADQLKFIPEFAEAFPDQKFVIDHLAKPNIKEQKIDDWRKDMMAFSSYKNLYCKISGMVTEADWKGWTKKDFAPYLDTIVEVFGMDRIMFGSDWPVCLVAASYKEMLDIVKDYFSSFSLNEQDKFFGGNAIEFYNLK